MHFEWDDTSAIYNPHVEESFKLFHRKSYGGDWEFNEIIGYIKLYFYGSQVRGEYWSTLPSKKVRTRKKQFEFKSYKLVAESPIWEKSNDGVLVAVEDYIERCKTHLKYRHIDIRGFENLKSHLDWLSLFKAKNHFRQKP